MFVGLFSIYVRDKQEMEILCRDVAKISEVNSCQRI
jgi:hypothetical protein